jgi:NADH-quinone oxidoreductase subunit L
MFHLTTHAFFKALLFLGAGSVIHALHHEQDLRRMGGLWKKLPITYAMMWVGSLALAGVPFLAGYYSKDTILEAVYAAHRPAATFAFALGIIAAFLTAFYSFRLVFMAFHGKTKLSKKAFDHAHEAPAGMWLPLLVLVAGAIVAGFVAQPWFVGADRAVFWQQALQVLPQHDVLAKIHHVPHWVPLLPTLMGLLGIALAIVLYVWRTTWPAKIAHACPKLYTLSQRKWFFDEAYEAAFQKPSLKLGNAFWVRGDQNTIDRFGPNGVSALAVHLASRLKKLQSGFIYHYATMMLLGVVVILSYILWRFYHAA